MKLEELDMRFKDSRKLSSLTQRITTSDFYLVKYRDRWITGKFCFNNSFWIFNTDAGHHQLSYKSDDILDESYKEIYKINDPDIIIQNALKSLS